MNRMGPARSVGNASSMVGPSIALIAGHSFTPSHGAGVNEAILDELSLAKPSRKSV